MKVVIYSQSLDANPVRASVMLDTVKSHGLDGCLFASPFDVSATLDLGEIRSDSVFFTIGALVDRLSRSVPRADQLAATTAFLKTLRPFLLDPGPRLDLTTHEGITIDECVRLVEMVGADAMGIGLDRLPATLAYLPTSLGTGRQQTVGASA